ncbi:MAG TPA: S16 family serine protease [Kofleriaceae bacterium]|nr:S16 family serine protease [Kofleriaceae bacterium]
MALAAVVAGCSASSPPSPSTGATPASVETRSIVVAPFDQDQTRPRYQAVILGSQPGDKSTVIPLAQADSEVTVDAMWVRLGDGSTATVGGSSVVRLGTRPQDDGQVRVGMYEQFAGGMGPQWRAAVWISSFVSATMLGKDLTDFKFTAENDGYIDGASAGALMTAGFLAALTGDAVDSKATMTGIVNPDGTVGPVGGIPHKFQASIEAGKKRLGYPVGQQLDYDLNARTKVDLVELAKKGGAEAVEIGDVYQAYTLLTGKQLPAPIPVEPQAMVLEAAVDAELLAKYQSWRTILSGEWDVLVELQNEGKLPFGLRTLADRADLEAREAERLMGEKQLAAAYERVVQAVVFAATATAVYQVLEHVRQGDIPSARDTLSQFQSTAAETEPALRKVGGMKPSTIGSHLLMISAYQHAIQGWGFHEFGSEQMVGAQRTLVGLGQKPVEQLAVDARLHEDLVRDVVPPVLSIARAVASTRMALESLEIEGVQSLDYMCSLPNVRRLAESFSSAAAANLKYYEALFVKDTANRFMVPEDRAQILLMRQNPDYLVAFMAFQLRRLPIGLPARLREEWGEKGLAWNLGMLAGSILSYYKTSLLISKNYSLNVQINPFTGEPTSVEHGKAFDNMMTSAERKAREHAHAARVATGSIPLQARLHYQAATPLRQSKRLADRIRALELYWSSSVYSQAAAMLARNG